MVEKNIRIMLANPAGNITAFVLDRFPRYKYQSIASQLLSLKELCAEQVAFVTGRNSMEMCGLEFCGNASRAFALMLAKKRNLKGDNYIRISVSGSKETLPVLVNSNTHYTKIQMPKPVSIKTLENTGIDFLDGEQLVDLGGIVHVVLQDISATRENFEQIKDFINEQYDPPAVGAMFYDSRKNTLVPIVYVKEVNSTYFEGSCGSGATAVAAAFSKEEQDGTFSYVLPQPAGTITSTIEKRNGQIQAMYIEGAVSLEEVRIISVQV